MPKATWGAGDNPLTADDIEGAERAETRTRYSGELPPAGTYRFLIQSIKKDISAKKKDGSGGNDKFVILATIDGTWRRNHKQYDGAPVFQHLAFTVANAKNVANFLDAIGAKSKDPYISILDDRGYVTKLGSVGDPAGLMVFCNVKHNTPTPEYPNKRLEVDYAGWMYCDDDSAGDDEAAGSSTDDGEEPPF
jgi:hypothetical protein